jgi:hypothetical protein
MTGDRERSGGHDTVFLPSQALRDESRRTAPPTAAPASFEPGSPVYGTDVVPASEPAPAARSLLDATLGALVVPGESAWSQHETGLVLALASSAAPVSFDPRALVARAGGAAPQPGSHGFSRATAGRLMLGPRTPGELVQLLDLAGESLVVQDRFLAAWGAEPAAGPQAAPVRHPAPWPLELLELSGPFRVVLGLPQPFLAYDVQHGDDFEIRTSVLVGWAGDLDVSLVSPASLASATARFAGNGTVLFLPGGSAATSVNLTERRMF